MAHRALAIPEILQAIASRLSRKDNARYLRINSTWHGALLSSVWFYLEEWQFSIIPTEALQRYGHYIRDLSLSLDEDEYEDEDDDDDQDILLVPAGDGRMLKNKELVCRAKCLTRLNYLTLTFLPAPDAGIPLTSLRALLSQHHETLEHLTLYNRNGLETRLTSLDLVRTALPAGMTFPNLESVDLVRWQIDDKNLDELLRRSPALKTLSLDRVRYDEEERQWMRLQNYVDFYSYTVDDYYPRPPPPPVPNLQLPPNFAQYPTVRTLKCQETTLAFVRRFPNLDLFSFDSCSRLDPASLGKMLRQHCPTLQRLYWDSQLTSCDSRSQDSELIMQGIQALTEFWWRTDQWRLLSDRARTPITSLWTFHAQTLEKVEIVCDKLYTSAMPFLEQCPRLRSLIIVTRFFATDRAACCGHELIGQEDMDRIHSQGLEAVAPATTAATPWLCARTLCTLAIGFTGLPEDSDVHLVLTALQFSRDAQGPRTPGLQNPAPFSVPGRSCGLSEQPDLDASTLRRQRLYCRLREMKRLQYIKLARTWYIRNPNLVI